MKLETNVKDRIVLYSASEFWMDSLPAFLLKLRYGSSVRWVAAWYQTAPNPLYGFAEAERSTRHRVRAFAYWFMQLPIKPLVSRFADLVLVNNEDERKQFPNHSRENKLFVLIGAVPLESINKYMSEFSKRNSKQKYDAVFQGRFHPQKGVVELIDIWKQVVVKKPDAKLGMIGDGPLMREVKKRITMNELTDNVELLGYVYDGPKKYDIFANSKLVLHPAFYDSGGMASAEAMAFGLPSVGFDLKSYESYYPKGMIKVTKGDIVAFSDAILDLLKNEKRRSKIGNDAKLMIEKYWSWDLRASNALEKIKSV